MIAWVTLVTGVGLSMDAVAASISSSTAARRVGWARALKMPAIFGLFQALMPAVGYAFGAAFRGWFESLDHWVAFVLLGFLGAKMIYEAGRERDESAGDPFATPKLLLLSVATSVDALVVGVSFSLLGLSLFTTVAVIGSVTFILCLPGGVARETVRREDGQASRDPRRHSLNRNRPQDSSRTLKRLNLYT